MKRVLRARSLSLPLLLSVTSIVLSSCTFCSTLASVCMYESNMFVYIIHCVGMLCSEQHNIAQCKRTLSLSFYCALLRQSNVTRVKPHNEGEYNVWNCLCRESTPLYITRLILFMTQSKATHDMSHLMRMNMYKISRQLYDDSIWISYYEMI